MNQQEKKKEEDVQNDKYQPYPDEDITWTVCMAILCLLGAIANLVQYISR